jgi:hypothetical protein
MKTLIICLLLLAANYTMAQNVAISNDGSLPCSM